MATNGIPTYSLPTSLLSAGDEVYFYTGRRGYTNKIRVVGVVEKVNRKSVKVRQTNDVGYWTQSAFGNRGGKRKGGEGYEWIVPVTGSGRTDLCWDYSYAEKVAKTTRGEAHILKARKSDTTESLQMLEYRIKRAIKHNVSKEDVLALVEELYADAE